MIIRISLLVIGLMFFFPENHAQEPKSEKVHWYSFEEALALQKQAPRKIFIDVYTDWCGWCKKMDKTTFKQQEVVNILNEKYYPVKFDAESGNPVAFMGRTFSNPRPGVARSTHHLTYALLGRKVSYPSFALLNEQNQRLTVLKGFMTKERLLPVLTFLGNDIYKEMEWEEYVSSQEKEKMEE